MLRAPQSAVFAFASALASLVIRAGDVGAQPTQGGYSTGPQNWQMGPPQPVPYMGPAPSYATTQEATDIELGTLYATSAGYGVGTGIWIDAELSIDDPGLKFLAPAILGVGGPVGVFLLNRPRMPRG